MSGEDVARVLDAEGALEEAFDEVAPGAEDDDEPRLFFLSKILF